MFPDWTYRRMVKSTNRVGWVLVAAGLIFAALGFAGILDGYQDRASGFVALAIAAVAFVARALLIKWYGLVYWRANGKFPDA